MDKTELKQKYDEVKKMCIGTELEKTPWKCVQFLSYGGREWLTCCENPKFNGAKGEYRFAVDIVNNKAVF